MSYMNYKTLTNQKHGFIVVVIRKYNKILTNAIQCSTTEYSRENWVD